MAADRGCGYYAAGNSFRVQNGSCPRLCSPEEIRTYCNPHLQRNRVLVSDGSARVRTSYNSPINTALEVTVD